jgi:DNA-binding CsgD family transcriptional regulator
MLPILVSNSPTREKGFAGFTARELKVIEWRTHGIKSAEIARRLGIAAQHGYDIMWRIYRKVGVDDVAMLTRWAMQNGLDEPLGPEDPADAEVKQPKVYKQRIELGRLRRGQLVPEE